MGNSKIRIGAALIDAKEHLMRIDGLLHAVKACKLCLAAFQPARRSCDRILNIVFFAGVFNAFVKGHRNGRTQVRLNPHTFLRPHKNLSAVNMGGKINALLLDISEFCQRKHLKAAAVGQDRTIPVHKPMQAAHIAHHLVTGAQMQMIRIGKLHLTANLF